MAQGVATDESPGGTSLVADVDYASAGGGATGARGVYTRLGAARSGLSLVSAAMGDFWEDFQSANSAAAEIGGYAWVTSAVSGTYSNQVANLAGGIVRINSTAGASRSLDVYNVNTLVQRLDTSRWYLAWRGRLTTAGDATTTFGCGYRNFANTKTVMAGFFGALDAAHFGVQYDGNMAGSVLSLVTVPDTAFHVFELYCTGDGTIRGRIDGGSEVAVAMVGAPTDTAGLFFTIRNGAGGAAQTGDLDWILSLFARI